VEDGIEIGKRVMDQLLAHHFQRLDTKDGGELRTD
jgi:hypothetical protein